jgi:hypothetical protein
MICGVVEREKASIGVLISMDDHSGPMVTEAVTAGFYESSSWGRKYPKIQLFTIVELLAGKQIDTPPIRQGGMTFKKAPKAGRGFFFFSWEIRGITKNAFCVHEKPKV